MPQADLTSHPIEGYAHAAQEQGDDGWFSVDLISHIWGNLWVGGCAGGGRLPEEFKHVISLYPWEQYILPEGCERTEHRLYDSSDVPDEDQLHDIAAYAVACVADGQTLVHCQAGLNRSNLIAGLALVHMGWDPQEAIALLRDRRCDVVLCNRAFEQWLLGLTKP